MTNKSDWPQVGDEVDVDNSPKFGPGSTRGTLIRLSATHYGAQAYVLVTNDDGEITSRIGCPVYVLTKTGDSATPDRIKALLAEEDRDDSEICKLVAESARLREYADVMDVLRMDHPDAARTLRAWDKKRERKRP